MSSEGSQKVNEQQAQNYIGQLNLVFEQTEQMVKQSFQETLMGLKEKCFKQSDKALDFVDCTNKKSQQFESLSKTMKLRLNFMEKKMEQCFQFDLNTEFDQFKKCGSQVVQVGKNVQDILMQELEKQ
ncbi:hypothetical protein PPERSA_12345 [Pseudocohnilembus persalinus]|uniref:Uncharacterized protein n=1 Tax=Pseudocohnilembus persalinus TaxID=266149 RepID=A0A0V0R0W5_PSEPJ|nr:hypothetical protein PPERSA_12345 [Pseudocohnilembus persalinus]|eukprot:KRX08190.1 hypothetical protein PPERSA_12345 [Pseudocohnilembus persalinus]